LILYLFFKQVKKIYPWYYYIIIILYIYTIPWYRLFDYKLFKGRFLFAEHWPPLHFLENILENIVSQDFCRTKISKTKPTLFGSWQLWDMQRKVDEPPANYSHSLTRVRLIPHTPIPWILQFGCQVNKQINYSLSQ